MPDEAAEQPRRAFHTLTQAAEELGISYRRVRALQKAGVFGPLTRSGPTGQGPYVVPDGLLRRVRDGERIAS